ncbi:MAG TPA: class IV adenylate cyclase [Candidatus Paceibacterota bacterium]|nr:class IV adenylate cyclase [Candidatus Paceibacterota bacterium]
MRWDFNGRQLNVEIKARCESHIPLRRILKAHGADFRGTDRQVDTYFRVPDGRLKLREGNIENTLIHYVRANKAGPKDSHITLFHTEPKSSLKGLLTRSLGILTVVDKRREIYFIGNVKFHLDTLAGIGKFVEIEAIDRDGSIGRPKLLAQCRRYMKEFGIRKADLLSRSYADMVLKRRI